MQNPHSQQRVIELFWQALDQDPRERPRFLQRACGDDREMHDRLRDLLQADTSPNALLDSIGQSTGLGPLSADETGRVRPQPAFHSGQTLGDRYRMETLLGIGGMGEVWRAIDLRLDVVVALKSIRHEVFRSDHALEFLRREVRSARAVLSANVCRVYDLVEVEGHELLSMEYLDGPTLLEVLEQRGPLGPDEAESVALQLLDGLEAVHEAGFTHGDVKPENIMITPEGRVVLMDLGLARSGTDLEPALGTPAYVAPERLDGAESDSRADIFSLGVVLAEMTAPRGISGHGFRESIQYDAHSDPSRLPDTVWRPVLERAVARDPARRHASVGELRHALLDVSSGPAGPQRGQGAQILMSTHPSPASPTHPLRRIVAGRGWRIALVVGAIAVLALLRWGPGALAPGPVIVGDARPTVLITPIEVGGPGEGARYVGRSFSNAMAANLVQIDGLVVLPVTDEALDPSSGGSAAGDLARARNASHLLSGSMSRESDSVHVTVTLVDVRKDRIAWAGQRTTSNDELSQLASSLSRDVVHALGVPPPKRYGHWRELLSASKMASSPLWATAVGALRRENAERALSATARLVELYPDDVDACVLRASALRRRMIDGHQGFAGDFDSLLVGIRRLDPAEPYPECVRIEELAWGRRYEEVLQRSTTLLDRTDLTPAARGWPLRNRAVARAALGDFTGASTDMEEATRLDPANSFNPLVSAKISTMADQLEEALAFAHQAAALNPTSVGAHIGIFRTLDSMGRTHEALEHRRRVCELSASMSYCAAYGLALFDEGDTTRAREVMTEARSLPESGLGVYRLARYAALTGQPTQAKLLLRRSMELGFFLHWIARDETLASLRGDAEFEAIVREVELRTAADHAVDHDAGKGTPVPW